MLKISQLVLLGVSFSIAPYAVAETAKSSRLVKKLGEKLFFDANLSNPPGQACAGCHDPAHHFVDPDAWLASSEGVIAGRFGIRNTPTATYTAFSPDFYFDPEEQLYLGGQFRDGRAANLAEQAKGPFLNPVEMANTDKAMVVAKVRSARYAALFKKVYGKHALDDIEQAYDNMAEAIAEFERGKQFNPFTSKYDYYLAGKVALSEREQRGLALFESEEKANCAACHPSQPGPNGEPPLFTDFSYDNIGVPKNPNLFFYALPSSFNPDGQGFVDVGLGGNPQVIADGRAATEKGKHKVPTLRNINRTGPWMHNGYFQTLQGVLDFYNTRDVKPACAEAMAAEAQARAKNCWPAPEVGENENKDELGALGLSDGEIADLLAFLQTLDDGYRVDRHR